MYNFNNYVEDVTIEWVKKAEIKSLCRMKDRLLRSIQAADAELERALLCLNNPIHEWDVSIGYEEAARATNFIVDASEAVELISDYLPIKYTLL